MREIGRIQQGYYPTQNRIVRAVSGLFKLPAQSNGAVTVLDAGCGTGQAIYDLRNAWLERCPDGSVSLLWFNPPYDRIRGAGRSEPALFSKVKDWPGKAGGLLLLIVPDYVLADSGSGLAMAVERDYELLGLWRYPEPEHAAFKQCVLLARRREKALNKTRLLFPRWACDPAVWPILPDTPQPVADLCPVRGNLSLRRVRLSDDLLLDTVSRSALRGAMLREATAAAPPIGRPLLPLKHGHLALALAGGLCDGIVQKNGVRFLVKGTLTSAIRKVATKDSFNSDGIKTAEIDTYKTRYEMSARCLLDNGSIENHTSAEPAEVVAGTDDDTEDA
jgi:hypothetical protein